MYCVFHLWCMHFYWKNVWILYEFQARYVSVRRQTYSRKSHAIRCIAIIEIHCAWYLYLEKQNKDDTVVIIMNVESCSVLGKLHGKLYTLFCHNTTIRNISAATLSIHLSVWWRVLWQQQVLPNTSIDYRDFVRYYWVFLNFVQLSPIKVWK